MQSVSEADETVDDAWAAPCQMAREMAQTLRALLAAPRPFLAPLSASTACDATVPACGDLDGAVACLPTPAAFRSDCERLLDLVPHGGDAQPRDRARVALRFLSFLLGQENVTGLQALEWIRDEGVIADGGLDQDLVAMIDVASIANNMADIPDSAFKIAACLVLVSHVADHWPRMIMVAPQDTLNFKIKGRTLIVDGGPEFHLFAVGPDNRSIFTTGPLAKAVDVYVESLLKTQISEWQSALCGLLTVAVAAIPPD